MADCLSLGVAGPDRPAFFRLELPPRTTGDVLVRTRYSGLSAGTELTYVKGTDPAFTARFDKELGVFVPGTAGRRYPVVAMGYMEVAEVVESDRQELPAGALVAAAYGHRSHHVLAPTDHRVVLPADLDPVLGIYLAQMGPIAANGLLHAAAELSRDGDPDLGAGVRGRHVLVTGAGVVGLLTGLLARRHGAATVVVADPDPHRLAAARGLGLGVLDESQQEPWRWCKETWHHGPGDRGADVVFQCRGRDSALHQALKSLRPQGTVVDLAFYQGGAAAVHLGEEFHHNGLTIRCAQINRVPRGLSPAWDRARLSAETADMLLAEAGPLREHLVTDVVAVEQAPQVVMELVRRQRHALQIVLDFGADRP